MGLAVYRLVQSLTVVAVVVLALVNFLYQNKDQEATASEPSAPVATTDIQDHRLKGAIPSAAKHLMHNSLPTDPALISGAFPHTGVQQHRRELEETRRSRKTTIKSTGGPGTRPTLPKTADLTCKDSQPSCLQRSQLGDCGSFEVGVLQCMESCKACAAVAAEVSIALAVKVRVTDAGDSTSTDDDVLSICIDLAWLGLCSSRNSSLAFWTLRLCPAECAAQLQASTGLQNFATCADAHPDCSTWISLGFDSTKKSFMSKHCRRSMKACAMQKDNRLSSSTTQAGQDAERAQQPGKTISMPKPDWFQIGVDSTGLARFAWYWPVSAMHCTDKEGNCRDYAERGECQRNPGWMSSNCPSSCGMCDSLRMLPQPLAKVRLNNGVLMPTIGYGSAGLGDGTYVAVKAALERGYRHIDSAQAHEWYREDMVGQALKDSGIARPDVFITSKLHPRHLGYDVTLTQFEESLKNLNTEYLDMFLLHYPECWGSLCEQKPAGNWRDSWRALEDLYIQGKVKTIGVSNFNEQQLLELLKMARVKPQALQVHVDPLGQSRALQQMCQDHGVQLVAYSTLGTQYPGSSNPVLNHPVLAKLATEQDNRTIAQVALTWALQSGVIVLPRSSNAARMSANLQLFDFALDETQMAAIYALDGSLQSL